MDTIETEYSESSAFTASCFSLVHTRKGRFWVRIGFTVLLAYFLLVAGPYKWDLPSLITGLKVVSFVIGFYIVCRLMLPISAATGYSGSHSTHGSMGYETKKIIRYTIQHQERTLNIEEQSVEDDTEYVYYSYPIDEMKVYKKMGNIFLVHKNKVHALLWTSNNLSFVAKLESKKSKLPSYRRRRWCFGIDSASGGSASGERDE